MWERASVFHVTIAPLVASKAAMSLQRVATLRCDVDDSAPRCANLFGVEFHFLPIHVHTSSISRATGRDGYFALIIARLYIADPVETHTIVVDGASVVT